MEMISQVHIPLPRHSFVALGLPRKAQCPCSGKEVLRRYRRPTHTHSRSRVCETATSGQGSCPRRSLPDRRNGSCTTFRWHASCSMQCPGTVTPPSQLCNKASRHSGTKPNNNQTNLTIRYVEFVRATVSWQALGPLHIQFKPWTAYQCQRIKCPTNTSPKAKKIEDFHVCQFSCCVVERKTEFVFLNQRLTTIMLQMTHLDRIRGTRAAGRAGELVSKPTHDMNAMRKAGRTAAP